MTSQYDSEHRSDERRSEPLMRRAVTLIFRNLNWIVLCALSLSIANLSITNYSPRSCLVGIVLRSPLRSPLRSGAGIPVVFLRILLSAELFV